MRLLICFILGAAVVLIAANTDAPVAQQQSVFEAKERIRHAGQAQLKNKTAEAVNLNGTQTNFIN